MPANWRAPDWREIAGAMAIVISGIWLGWGASAVMLVLAAMLIYQDFRPRAYVADESQTVVGTRHVLAAIRTPDRRKSTRAVRDALAARPAASRLQVWLIGQDKAGGVWTWVAEDNGLAAPTLEVDLEPGSDPVQSAHEAVSRWADLPVTNISIRAWSTEQSRGDAFVVVTVETSLPAERFNELPLPGMCHFVEVHPASLSPLMVRMGSSRWPDPTLLGVLAVCDAYIAGGQESLAARLGREWDLPANATGQRELAVPEHGEIKIEEPAPPSDAVSADDADEADQPADGRAEAPQPKVALPEEVVMLYGRKGEVVPMRRRRYPSDRVLSWEPPERSVPNRY